MMENGSMGNVVVGPRWETNKLPISQTQWGIFSSRKQTASSQSIRRASKPPRALAGTPQQIDEELRVAYVAVTRAKHELYLYEPMKAVKTENYFPFGDLWAKKNFTDLFKEWKENFMVTQVIFLLGIKKEKNDNKYNSWEKENE